MSELEAKYGSHENCPWHQGPTEPETEMCEFCGEEEATKQADGFTWIRENGADKKVAKRMAICEHCLIFEREYDNIEHETSELVTLKS